VSIAFIVVTAGLLIATVEREINAIWGDARSRPLLRRFFVYALGASAGPALVGASISLTTWLITESVAAVPLHGGSAVVLKALPLVLSTMALALLYAVVPVRRVPWRHAITGGFAAALAFEGAKHGFAFYVRHVPTYEIVYGALAALPVFLVWIYVCWVIVLIGAAITAALTLGPQPARRSPATRARS
jgi:membrane protein